MVGSPVGSLLVSHLALVGLTSARYAASSGQITFLILDLLLATLILADHKALDCWTYAWAGTFKIFFGSGDSHCSFS